MSRRFTPTITVAGVSYPQTEITLLPVPVVPAITSFLPTTGAPGTVVTVTGTNFLSGQEMRVGGVISPTVVVLNATTATLVVPAGAFTGVIRVTNIVGTANSVAGFTVLGGGVDPYRPVYDVPTFLDWNSTTKLHDLKPAKATALAYATNVPHPSLSVYIDGSDNRANNMLLVNNAITAAIAASGTVNCRALARIRLNPVRKLSGVMNLRNVDLTDELGTPVWLYVETNALASLPAQGTRITPTDAMNMPMLGMTTYNQATVQYNWTTRRVRLTGLHISIDDIVAAAIALDPSNKPGLNPGTAANIPFTYYGVFGQGIDVAPSNLLEAQDVILDRCYVPIQDGVDVRVAVSANIARFALLDSWVSSYGDVNWVDASTVRVFALVGGEWIVSNTTIEGGRGEWLWTGGGGGIGTPLRIPKDVFITRCHLTCPDRWLLNGKALCKNAWEMKIGDRHLMEACLITNCWSAGNLGNQFHTIVFKTADQAASQAAEEPFVYTKNITMRACVLRRCTGAWGLALGNRLNTFTQESRLGFESPKRYEISHCVKEPWNYDEFNVLYPNSVNKFDTRGIYINSGVVRTTVVPDGQPPVPDAPEEWYLVTDVSVIHISLGSAMGIAQGGRKYVRSVMIDRGTNSPLVRHRYLSNAFFGDYVQQFDAPLTITGVNGIMSPILGWADIQAQPLTSTDVRNNVMGTVANPATMFTTPLGPTNIARTDNLFGQDMTTLRLLPGSMLLGAGHDGLDIGADFDLIDRAMLHTETGRAP
jgi:hypothetical protein